MFEVGDTITPVFDSGGRLLRNEVSVRRKHIDELKSTAPDIPVYGQGQGKDIPLARPLPPVEAAVVAAPKQQKQVAAVVAVPK